MTWQPVHHAIGLHCSIYTCKSTAIVIYLFLIALDGTDDDRLFCFNENNAGRRLLQSQRPACSVVEADGSLSSSSTSAADDADMELEMTVERITEEDEENEPFIDDSDSDDESDECDDIEDSDD
jgi:hypothetical protein